MSNYKVSLRLTRLDEAVALYWGAVPEADRRFLALDRISINVRRFIVPLTWKDRRSKVRKFLYLHGKNGLLDVQENLPSGIDEEILKVTRPYLTP